MIPSCFFCDKFPTHEIQGKHDNFPLYFCDDHCPPNVRHERCKPIHAPASIEEALATGIVPKDLRHLEVAAIVGRLFERVGFLEARQTELQLNNTQLVGEARGAERRLEYFEASQAEWLAEKERLLSGLRARR